MYIRRRRFRQNSFCSAESASICRHSSCVSTAACELWENDLPGDTRVHEPAGEDIERSPLSGSRKATRI